MNTSQSAGKESCNGMAATKKRTQSPSVPQQSIDLPFSWVADGVQVLLPPSQQVLFSGTGVLTVQSGEIELAGNIRSAGGGPLRLSVDSDAPLRISVAAIDATVPLSGTGRAAFSISGGSTQRKSFEVLLASDTRAHKPFEVPPDWRQVATTIASSVDAGRTAGGPPAVVVICGAKKVGKSTFSRCLTNNLLNTLPCVAYLDVGELLAVPSFVGLSSVVFLLTVFLITGAPHKTLYTDCGQPEFTPPGLVSLSLLTAPVVGLPHHHQHMPSRAHFIGDISPAADPVYFVQCIASLYTWYYTHARSHWSRRGVGDDDATKRLDSSDLLILPPLIVNTHGWIKGFGLDILVDVLQQLAITHFVHICSPNTRKNLPSGYFWASEKSSAPCRAMPPPVMYEIPAASSASAAPDGAGWHTGGSESHGGVPAVEQRALHWNAFAEACIACGRNNDCVSNLEEGGHDLDYDSVGDRLAAAVPYEVAFSDVCVNILHAQVPTSQFAFVLNGAVVGLMTSSVAPLKAEGPAVCLGLGIVRAIDPDLKKIYVLTPLKEDVLQRVSVLGVGRLELPPGLLQTKRFLSPYLALHSLVASGTGAGTQRARNNLLRASHLK